MPTPHVEEPYCRCGWGFFFDQADWANFTSHIGLPSLVVPVVTITQGLPMGISADPLVSGIGAWIKARRSCAVLSTTSASPSEDRHTSPLTCDFKLAEAHCSCSP
ncbi:hypothetical protein ACM01_03915 [Streptomyces viridochromogenes]|uniref:Uncharacterized protein n=1 Tax=Streptomyces viridochromogenes TaxID=1938 RepID=A0A0J7ZPB4_STRVR|nr:hypothetical protein ACM01_03915 [Streptomyces viridochromogenes]